MLWQGNKIRIMEIRKGNWFTEMMSSHQRASGPKICPKMDTIQGDTGKVIGGKGCPEGSEKLAKILRRRHYFHYICSTRRNSAPTTYKYCSRWYDMRPSGASSIERNTDKHVGNWNIARWRSHWSCTGRYLSTQKGHIPSPWACRNSSWRKWSLCWGLRCEKTLSVKGKWWDQCSRKKENVCISRRGWAKELEVMCDQALSAGWEKWKEMELLRWTVAR